MTFWGAFFGVTFGVVAGVFINLIIGWIQNKKSQSNMIRNIKFEIDFNIKKIESFLKELGRYRNKVNGDSLQIYFGYFNLSKVITTTMVQMFFRGTIYNYLGYEEIGKLQNFTSYFSLGMENVINNQINYNKTHANEPGIKQMAIADIEFWEKKFKESIADLKSIKKNIMKR